MSESLLERTKNLIAEADVWKSSRDNAGLNSEDLPFWQMRECLHLFYKAQTEVIEDVTPSDIALLVCQTAFEGMFNPMWVSLARSYRELKAENAKLRAALEKIYNYRSDVPDWNMIMAIAGNIIEPMELGFSEGTK